MGHNGPKPDKWPVEAWRRCAPTVWDMKCQEWQVKARCETCRLILRVDLNAVIKKKGRKFSLWNVRTRCRNGAPEPFGCLGTMMFESKPPGAMRVFRLECEETGEVPMRRRTGPNWF
jgi:hypothetical protein